MALFSNDSSSELEVEFDENEFQIGKIWVSCLKLQTKKDFDKIVILPSINVKL